MLIKCSAYPAFVDTAKKQICTLVNADGHAARTLYNLSYKVKYNQDMFIL